MDVADADLDVVQDLAGQGHDEALLLLGALAVRILLRLGHFLESLDSVLDQLLLDVLELVLLLHEARPLAVVERLHQQLKSLYLKLHRLRREGVPGHADKQFLDAANDEPDGHVHLAEDRLLEVQVLQIDDSRVYLARDEMFDWHLPTS